MFLEFRIQQMEEAKDSAIKLFGRTILLTEVLVEAAAETVGNDLDDSIRSVEERACPSSVDLPDKNDDSNGDDDEPEEEESANKDSLGATATTTTDANTEEDVNELTEPNTINHNSESTTTSSKDEEQDQEHETKSENDKTLKKPDKILPCPRCKSMDTKFCYYNNYNVNQPRHYCKRCQRYWTAGGIMRNVPIGAGRRKNKNLLTSQCRLVAHHGHLPNGTHPNHAVLNFGYDQGRLQEFPDTGKILTKSKKDDASNEEQSDELMQYSHRVPPPPPPPQAWPFPWNPIQWNSPLSAFSLSPSGYRLPFYPSPPFWGCNSVPPSVSNVPNSQTLGKHSRDSNVVKPSNPGKEEGNPGKCFWVPKPLRIDDLGEAARSSMWKTLGIKMEKTDLVGEKGDFLRTSSVLQANPAAFSRSLNFRENM